MTQPQPACWMRVFVVEAIVECTPTFSFSSIAVSDGHSRFLPFPQHTARTNLGPTHISPPAPGNGETPLTMPVVNTLHDPAFPCPSGAAWCHVMPQLTLFGRFTDYHHTSLHTHQPPARCGTRNAAVLRGRPRYGCNPTWPTNNGWLVCPLLASAWPKTESEAPATQGQTTRAWIGGVG